MSENKKSLFPKKPQNSEATMKKIDAWVENKNSEPSDGKTKIRQVTVKIPHDLYFKLKLYCLQQEQTLQEMLIATIEEKLK